jgi:hypothetical protein
VRPQCLINTASSQRGDAQWEAGSDTAAWRSMPTAPITGDRPQRRITLRLLDKLQADATTSSPVWHVLGCKQQFEAWMRERAATENRPTPAPGFLELSYATQHVHRLLCRRRPH